MKRTRTDLLNLICSIRKPQRYLEIGIQDGVNFQAVKCPMKVGVDPKPECDLPWVRYQTSDQFFQTYKGEPFDLIFIDGDHSYRQTQKDIANAIDHLNEGGLIVCHDALPHNLEYTGPEWCGTAYKAIMAFASKPYIIPCTWEGDHGCAILFVDHEGNHGRSLLEEEPTFENLWANDAAIVNKSTWEEVEEWLKQLD